MGVEREVKLGADEAFTLPDLRECVPGAVVDDRGTLLLEAGYRDTRDLALAHAHHGLRHRRERDAGGGVREIWTLKTPSVLDGDAVVRGEHEVEGPDGAPPPALLELVEPVLHGRPLEVVARLRTSRRLLVVHAGGIEVEVTDDSVEVLNAEGGVAGRFRELEVEHGEDAKALAAAVVARLRAAGAADPAAASKYGRALTLLGLAPPADAG